MSSRADRPDTQADIAIRSAISNKERLPFVVKAGAGSGKTTSLIKALAYILNEYGGSLKSHNQQIACITYTQVAADEIHEDVANDPLVLVSTIHSFLWTLVRPFQTDIREWVNTKITADMDEISSKTYGPRVAQATKDKDALKLADLGDAQQQLEQVSRFIYGTGSDYAKGILGHEDILSIAPDLIQSKPLLAKIIIQKYPFILVDESQDTFDNVISSLKFLQQASEGSLSLGFFGDPMQSIYQRGAGDISLEEGWISIDKPENYRSSKKVLEVVNAVRRDGDSLVQTAGRDEENTPAGEVFFFVLPADEERVENLDKVRSWLEQHSNEAGWLESSESSKLKILAIVHRMAARRLGFEDLFAAFNDNGSSLSDDFREGSAWPISPFRDVILPLIQAPSLSDPKVLDTLRNFSSIFSEDMKGDQVKDTLGEARQAVESIRTAAAEDAVGSVGEIIRLAIESKVIVPDSRMMAFLSENGVYDGVEVSESTQAVLNGFFSCKISEVQNYRKYVEEESPYSTQHGTKGSEFDKVIVILDDDEGSYSLYSFEKYLGIKPLSKTDEKNMQEGKETVVDRTRRLFYVCVSRTMTSLAILLFTQDVPGGAAALRSSDIVGSADILTLEDIS